MKHNLGSIICLSADKFLRAYSNSLSPQNFACVELPSEPTKVFSTFLLGIIFQNKILFSFSYPLKMGQLLVGLPTALLACGGKNLLKCDYLCVAFVYLLLATVKNQKLFKSNISVYITKTVAE